MGIRSTTTSTFTTEMRNDVLYVVHTESTQHRATRAVKNGTVQMHYIGGPGSLRGAMFFVGFVPTGGEALVWNEARYISEANKLFDNLCELHDHD